VTGRDQEKNSSKGSRPRPNSAPVGSARIGGEKSVGIMGARVGRATGGNPEIAGGKGRPADPAQPQNAILTKRASGKQQGRRNGPNQKPRRKEKKKKKGDGSRQYSTRAGRHWKKTRPQRAGRRAGTKERVAKNA